MSKTKPETVAERISTNFQTYLGKGVRLEPFLRDSEPSLRIDGLDSLLRIHFLLYDEGDEQVPTVSSFVEQLPDRIRNLKTGTHRRTEFQQGEVRGRIDWHETTKLRYQSPEPSDLRFACTKPDVRYLIPENLVLVRLLDVIEDILTTELADERKDSSGFDWLEPWIVGDSGDSPGLAESFLQFRRENVYLDRIEVGPDEVTERMIRSVGNSRRNFYRQAASLLDLYRRLVSHDFDKSTARNVLADTLIRPGKKETLFELYWAFQLLEQFPSARYELLRQKDSTVAEWHTPESTFRLYHDSTGSDSVRFRETIEEVLQEGQNEYLERQAAVKETWGRISDDLLDRSTHGSLWGGRPDILLERSPAGDNTPSDLFIGEVKYSRNAEYIRSGLRELLEYIAFLRISDNPFVPTDEIGTSPRVHGGLFVDELPGDRSGDTPLNYGSVTVYQFEDRFRNPFQ